MHVAAFSKTKINDGVLYLLSALGYGSSEQGSKGGAWYIPANSNLHFDIEIVGKGGKGPAKEEL